MHPNKTRKLTRKTLGFTLFLIIFNIFTPFTYATEWSPDTRLTWDNSLDWSPSIAQAKDGRIWVVWHSFEIGTNPDIFYKIYNGSSTFPWSSTKRLTKDSSIDRTPSITATDENLWVVWSSNRDNNFEIYYKIYHGSSWSPDTRLTNHISKDEFPSVMQDKDGDIWVAWSSNRTGDPGEIFCSIYNGTGWSPPIRLTSNLADDWDPSIIQAADESIWLVWVRDDNVHYKVFYENMTLKTHDTSLTEGSNINWHPSITQTQDGAIWVAWDSYKLGMDTDIYCKIYNGFWSEERLTYNDASDDMPTIMQTASGTMWVAWTSSRLSNFDIYYKTNPPPQYLHDIAIVSVTRNPDTTQVRKGLNVSIEVVPQNQGLKTENFVVSCYANSTLIGSKNVSLCPGQLMPINFLWQTSAIDSGIYTITAQVSVVSGETDTADNTFIDGKVLVRILGDADFNGLVEMPDFYMWRGNFGKTPDRFPPGVYPDFDVNGLVEMPDFYIWRGNFGAQ